MTNDKTIECPCCGLKTMAVDSSTGRFTCNFCEFSFPADPCALVAIIPEMELYVKEFIRSFIRKEKIKEVDDFRHVLDSQATEEIKEFLKELKKGGEKDFDVIDVYQETKLPYDQINRILEKLKKR